MPSSKSLATSVLGKLKDRSLPIWPGTLDYNVLGILHGNNYASSQLQLLPSLSQVDHIDSVVTPPVYVSLHLKIAILCSQVALRRQHKLDIGLLLAELHGANLAPGTLYNPAPDWH